MRNFTTFLLFETFFDTLPQVSTGVTRFAKKVLEPSVRITEEDCGTRLGEVLPLLRGDRVVGRKVLFTYSTDDVPVLAGDILTPDQVTELLRKRSEVHTRSLHSCVAAGGVCRECLQSFDLEKYPDMSYVPPVGTTIRIVSPSTRPYLGYLASTYTGGLLGIRSFLNERLPIREELLRSRIGEAELSQVFREVSAIEGVDPKYIDYASSISDNLEKALFLIILYIFEYYVES